MSSSSCYTPSVTAQESAAADTECGVSQATVTTVELDGQQEGDLENPQYWATYNQKAQRAAQTLADNLNRSLDGLLLLAGVLSAAFATFTAESTSSDDYNAIIAFELRELKDLAHAVLSGDPSDAYHSSAPYYLQAEPSAKVAADVLFTISLSLALLTALACALEKQWIEYYKSSPEGTPQQCAFIWHSRRENFKKWKVESIIELQPMALHFSLFFFLGALAANSAPYTRPESVGDYVNTTIYSCAAALYVFAVILPLLQPSCAFKTPMCDHATAVLGAFKGWRYGEKYFASREREAVERQFRRSTTVPTWLQEYDSPTVPATT